MTNYNHYLDLNELNIIKSNSDKNLDTFIYLLKQCHSKIIEYNKQHKSKFCYYKPPPYIIGKPLYNYYELVNFLITELSKNGLFAKLTEDGILISWDNKLLNHDEYNKLKQSIETNMNSNTIDNSSTNTTNTDNNKNSTTYKTNTNLGVERKTPVVNKKKSKTKTEDGSIYHVNVNDDSIPINFKSNT